MDRPLTYHQMVEQARREIDELTPGDLEARRDRVVLIDVREPDEFAGGVIPGALLIPRGTLEGDIEGAVDDRDRPIVLYCASGARSALAAKALREMGFPNTANLIGGIEQWRREGRSVEMPAGLTDQGRARYARHLVIPEIGEEGQQRLLDSRMAVIGAGGLGSPAALYLAAAGVGTIGLIDYDVVDVTNLQRQVIHTDARIGTSKVESARTTLEALNPEVEVRTHPVRLQADNVLDVLGGYDVVIDGSDTFPTRYLVNDAALHLRVPVVTGSILRFEGQATVIDPYAGPCYRCLFPEPPPPELAPSCEEAGVLGVLPGVIGSIQAMEAMKLVLGIGQPLVGRLLVYDALEQRFSVFEMGRDPDCPACGDEAQPPRLVDYDPACRPAGAVARTAI